MFKCLWMFLWAGAGGKVAVTILCLAFDYISFSQPLFHTPSSTKCFQSFSFSITDPWLPTVNFNTTVILFWEWVNNEITILANEIQKCRF